MLEIMKSVKKVNHVVLLLGAMVLVWPKQSAEAVPAGKYAGQQGVPRHMLRVNHAKKNGNPAQKANQNKILPQEHLIRNSQARQRVLQKTNRYKNKKQLTAHKTKIQSVLGLLDVHRKKISDKITKHQKELRGVKARTGFKSKFVAYFSSDKKNKFNHDLLLKSQIEQELTDSYLEAKTAQKKYDMNLAELDVVENAFNNFGS